MLRILGVVLLFVFGGPGCGSAVPGDPPARAANLSLHVEGMMCEASCAKTVEKVLAARPGVEEVVVDFERKQARCRIDPETFDAAAAIAELADQDFVATVEQ